MHHLSWETFYPKYFCPVSATLYGRHYDKPRLSYKIYVFLFLVYLKIYIFKIYSYVLWHNDNKGQKKSFKAHSHNNSGHTTTTTSQTLEWHFKMNGWVILEQLFLIPRFFFLLKTVHRFSFWFYIVPKIMVLCCCFFSHRTELARVSIQKWRHWVQMRAIINVTSAQLRLNFCYIEFIFNISMGCIEPQSCLAGSEY